MAALVIGGIFWLTGGADPSVVLDSADEVITEDIDNGSKGFFKRILSQDSPLAALMVFADNFSLGASSDKIGGQAGGGPEDDSGSIARLETVSQNAVVAQGPVLAIIPLDGSIQASFENSSVLTYEIEAGDNLQSIADDFGISLETLLEANHIPAGTKLKPGDKLSILPIDGLHYTVKAGDTIQGLAIKYKADTDRIIAFNGLPDDGRIVPGEVLIIPDGELPHVPLSPKNAPEKIVPASQLPNLVGYYGLPAGGRVTNGLHPFNAVDLGGRDWCNTPLYAAAAGTVIKAASAGWNGGYGKYIKIAHDNGTITLYAHASQVLVSEGAFVSKGQVIGLMGSTGNSTGCHVHFEVRGAKNPLAK